MGFRESGVSPTARTSNLIGEDMIENMPGWLSFAQEASLPTLAVAGLFFAIAQFIKVLPQLKQLREESDKSMRSDLLARVDVLEAEVKTLRKALDNARTSHASEMMDMLHDLTSESGQLDAALMLAEFSPDALLAKIPQIREQREKHRERINAKRGVREAAMLSNAEPSGEL